MLILVEQTDAEERHALTGVPQEKIPHHPLAVEQAEQKVLAVFRPRQRLRHRRVVK